MALAFVRAGLTAACAVVFGQYSTFRRMFVVRRSQVGLADYNPGNTTSQRLHTTGMRSRAVRLCHSRLRGLALRQNAHSNWTDLQLRVPVSCCVSPSRWCVRQEAEDVYFTALQLCRLVSWKSVFFSISYSRIVFVALETSRCVL